MADEDQGQPDEGSPVMTLDINAHNYSGLWLSDSSGETRFNLGALPLNQ